MNRVAILNSGASKLQLRQQLEEARRQTDAIFDIISSKAFYERPIEARHRIIFYLGHLEAFDWNMIGRSSFGLKPLHQEFEQLFSFGIDPVDGNLPRDKASDWPDVAAVRQYNVRARNAVDDCLNKADFSKREQPYVESGLIFWTALEHRLMHLETLSYMFHWLPYEMKTGLSRPVTDFQRQAIAGKIRVPAGEAKLGINRADGSEFGWDNEFESHIVDVPEFEIDVYKVSNGEFLKFVEAGAYEERSHWKEADWEWISSEGIRHPKFWVKRRNGWWYRAMFDEIPMPQSWPVYVSHAEASAYARWKEQMLPTEAEFHRASLGQKVQGNLGLHGWDPVAVQANKDATSTFGVVEMVGNGWEWTSSAFGPFPGFERLPFYPGYSADFFDNKHFVVKGASARTASRLTRPSFRNWFQPHYPYIYAGFRCVQH
jgi:ergothioneine biosynthesis protein EgtB